jgi:uncharacterized protein (TIGR00661 family)
LAKGSGQFDTVTRDEFFLNLRTLVIRSKYLLTFLSVKKQKTILISPLDWGLGHATRVTPIINYLLEKNLRVILAADGRSYNYFQKEFPSLKVYRLPGIRVNYSKSLPFGVTMFSQIPKIFLGIYREKRGLKQLLKKETIDLIISDNRYGLSCKHVPSVFISHQVNVVVPEQFRFATSFVRRVITAMANQFTYHWIPDLKEEPNLAGMLSHPPAKAESKYIGVLSRLKTLKTTEKLDFLILLSGPEPQRSMFEQKILSSPEIKKHRTVIVRGLPENTSLPESMRDITVINYANADQLSSLICSAKFVLCRSGYSTLMDLYRLQTPAVIVPTPGQTEQEYLAKHLNNGCFKSMKQKKFTLEKAISLGSSLKKPEKPADRESFKSAVDKVIDLHLK